MRNYRILPLLALALLLFVPGWQFQAVGWFVVAVGLGSALASWSIRRRLVVSCQRSVVRGYCHERIEIRLTIINGSPFPVTAMAVKDDTGTLHADGGNVATASLPPFGKFEMSYTVSSAQRGLHRIGPLHLASADPFGLFPWETFWDLARQVVVFPIAEPVARDPGTGQAGNLHLSFDPAHVDLTRLRSIRPYRAGDDPRHIHWPASASTGELQYREYTRRQDRPCHVVLNLREADFAIRRKGHNLERCIAAAAALCQAVSDAGDQMGFSCNGSVPTDSLERIDLPHPPAGCWHLPPDASPQALGMVMSLLSVAGFGTDPFTDMIAAIGFQNRPRIVVIGPPPLEADLLATYALVPRTCPLDFWVLDEQVAHADRVDHLRPVPLPGIAVRRLAPHGAFALRNDHD